MLILRKAILRVDVFKVKLFYERGILVFFYFGCFVSGFNFFVFRLIGF